MATSTLLGWSSAASPCRPWPPPRPASACLRTGAVRRVLAGSPRSGVAAGWKRLARLGRGKVHAPPWISPVVTARDQGCPPGGRRRRHPHRRRGRPGFIGDDPVPVRPSAQGVAMPFRWEPWAVLTRPGRCGVRQEVLLTSRRRGRIRRATPKERCRVSARRVGLGVGQTFPGHSAVITPPGVRRGFHGAEGTATGGSFVRREFRNFGKAAVGFLAVAGSGCSPSLIGNPWLALALVAIGFCWFLVAVGEMASHGDAFRRA